MKKTQTTEFALQHSSISNSKLIAMDLLFLKRTGKRRKCSIVVMPEYVAATCCLDFYDRVHADIKVYVNDECTHHFDDYSNR